MGEDGGLLILQGCMTSSPLPNVINLLSNPTDSITNSICYRGSTCHNMKQKYHLP